MKLLCLFLVVAVLVGLASSNPIECKEDEYILVDVCMAHCIPKKEDNDKLLGGCVVTSSHRVYYNYDARATAFYECWKCTGSHKIQP